MKIVTIFQDGCDRIVIQDNDDLDLKEYVKKIEEIFKYSVITTLHTSSGSVIIRPKKLLSIMVEDLETGEKTEDIQIQEPEKVEEVLETNEQKESTEEVDMITDGESWLIIYNFLQHLVL